jgi:hypothetical protein
MKTLFTSKKFLVALVGLVVATTAHFGLNLDEAAILTLLTPILAYIGAQGIADFGKEKAKVEVGE